MNIYTLKGQVCVEQVNSFSFTEKNTRDQFVQKNILPPVIAGECARGQSAHFYISPT